MSRSSSAMACRKPSSSSSPPYQLNGPLGRPCITRKSRRFCVAASGPSKMVTIVSSARQRNAGSKTNKVQRGSLEFVISTAAEAPRAVELLAMTVYCNRTGRLGLGHTVPIGEPWLPGSACDHLLVCLPYPFGPGLQTCHVGDLHVDVLWLLPITRAERDFKAAHGQEALERQFEEAGWSIGRSAASR